jgi:4-amino-4-deoxy-L-arabinose transferase-like glycosyltransferase/protein-S-isoprenylcysteine O-methyltransferase Ste14/membrane-associated phospholipid phosphatase
MALVDDVPKLLLATLVMGFSLLALWTAFHQGAPVAILFHRLWSGRGRRLVVAGLALAVFAVVAEDVFFDERDELILRLDTEIRGALHPLAPSLHGMAMVVSKLTGEGLAVAVAVASLTLLLRQQYRLALMLVLGPLAAWSISGILKVAGGIPRPRVDEAARLFTSYGFPSGHTFVTLVACGLIAWALGRHAKPAVRVGLMAGAWAVAMLAGVSRILLNAHWPSDVVAGLALGVAWLELMMLCAEPRGEKPGAVTQPPTNSWPWADRRTLEGLGIGALAVLLVTTDLGGRIFQNNDEARFPLLARDILEHGNWVLPTINGAVYYNKPPLLAWLIALVSWPLGHVTQMTAVLPSAAAAVATVLIVYAIGRDLFGQEAGRYAALVAMTSQGLLLHARLALPDMLMTCFVTASLWMLLKAVRGARRSSWLGFSAFTAAAFWTKGLAGLLPLAVGLGVWGRTRRLGRRPSLGFALSLLLLAALVAAWWVLGASIDRAGVRDAVVGDQLMWYLPQAPTISMLTAPLQNAFGIFFPWILLAPVVVTQAVRFARGRGTERDRVVFLVIWAAVTVTILAFSHQQRLRYYLPLVPPLSLLTGWFLFGAVTRRRKVDRALWRWYAVTGGALVAATVAGALSKRRADVGVALPASAFEALVTLAAVGLFAGLLILGIVRNRLRRPFAIAWTVLALLLVAGHHWQLQRHNAAYDFPGLYAHAAPALRDAAVVAAWGVPEHPLAFYFNRPVVSVDEIGDLERLVAGGDRFIGIVPDTARDQVGEDAGLSFTLVGRIRSHPIWLVQPGPSTVPENVAAVSSARDHRSMQSVLAGFSGGLALEAARVGRVALRYAFFPLTWASDLEWEAGAFALALLGLAFRLYTIGITAGGGHPTGRLDTTGPYSIVRHPLYFANLLIALGLSVFPHEWVGPVVVMVVAAVYYGRKVREDEARLHARFGTEFEQWASAVPAILPRLSGYLPSGRRFDVRFIGQREYIWAAMIFVIPFFLDLVEDFLETDDLVFDPVWAGVAVLGMILLVTSRMLTGPSPRPRTSG